VPILLHKRFNPFFHGEKGHIGWSVFVGANYGTKGVWNPKDRDYFFTPRKKSQKYIQRRRKEGKKRNPSKIECLSPFESNNQLSRVMQHGAKSDAAWCERRCSKVCSSTHHGAQVDAAWCVNKTCFTMLATQKVRLLIKKKRN
jgi:hypothetical protein